MKQYSEEQLKILVGVAVILKEDYYKIDKNRFSFKKLRTVVDLGEELLDRLVRAPVRPVVRGNDPVGL